MTIKLYVSAQNHMHHPEIQNFMARVRKEITPARSYPIVVLLPPRRENLILILKPTGSLFKSSVKWAENCTIQYIK